MLKEIAIAALLITNSLILSGYSYFSRQESVIEAYKSEQTLMSGGYWLQELFGVSKRDILVQAISNAISSQLETQEQFETALEEFKSVVDFDGGELETLYNNINDEYEKSKNYANSFSNHIEDVERVSERLFTEWQQEIKIYENSKLRAASSRKLVKTQAECKRLIGLMKQAETKIDPVLIIFRDRVLFLKHNLNAEAIAAIESDLSLMKIEINKLTTEIQNSVDEADRFINNLVAS